MARAQAAKTGQKTGAMTPSTINLASKSRSRSSRRLRVLCARLRAYSSEQQVACPASYVVVPVICGVGCLDLR